jgi:hypothetical protein
MYKTWLEEFYIQMLLTNKIIHGFALHTIVSSFQFQVDND